MSLIRTLPIVLSLVCVALTASIPAGPSPRGEIEWLTIEEAFAKIQQKPKKVMIDVYTEWCGWCKVMDTKTFSNPTVARYVSQQFYAVKLDAEQREPITLGTNEYKFVENGKRGYHEIAVALLQGKLSYPTVVFLDEGFNMIQPIPGYKDAKNFHQIITFLGGNHHKKEDFDQFVSSTYVSQYQD